ncbi:neuroguidin [Heteronotia binoei]|uniref:neuroguidin n=1 Tax=Heteronotia binoei TaxID=13085 RepID=UPI0029313AD3|nr:neuroguidin [Heteronotia binoei]
MLHSGPPPTSFSFYEISGWDPLPVKADGCGLVGQSLIPSIFWQVLEKMRPIDQKLKYQVDKLVKAAVTGALGENDPLRFKPNPGNLMSKLSDSEEEESEEAADGAKGSGKVASKGGSRKYVPPRLVPVHYDETEAEKEKKMLEQAKKRALSSSIIRELKEQYSDAPEEIREGRYAHTTRQSREDEHRTSYEESMMVRLNVSRKEKARRRRAGTLASQLTTLTHFGDISALTGAAPPLDEDLSPQKKKRKKIGTRYGKKKKGECGCESSFAEQAAP